MKAFLGLGKLVTLAFWGTVLVNLLHPFAYPLNWLLSIAGGLILLIHLIEILVLGRRLKARAHPGWIASRSCCSVCSTCSRCRP